MIAIGEDLKQTVASYRELRLRVIEDLRRLNDYSLILFKSFLQYVKDNRGEKSFPELLDDFLSSELGLNWKEDAPIRLSLMRRFYNLAGKKIRDEGIQESLLPYLE